MRAYVISVKGDEDENNKRLCSLLKSHGYIVSLVEGVYGPALDAQTYFFAIQDYFGASNRLLSPSELGCTLSHKKAYDDFITTDDECALFIEDDAIIDDAALTSIAKLAHTELHRHGWVHLGGQEGLEQSFMKVGGSIVNRDPMVFKVYREDLEWLYRTVGYVISREIAGKLSAALITHAFAIDDFVYMNKVAGINNYYFSKIIRHPANLEASAIQAERAIYKRAIDVRAASLAERLLAEIKKTADYRIKMIKQKMRSNKSLILKNID
jgi:glycosyl transferase family 25